MSKANGFKFAILPQAVVAAIGEAFGAMEAAENALYAAAKEMVDAGFKPENLDKDAAQYNEALLQEVRQAVRVRFSAEARKTLDAADKSIAASTKQESDLRHMYKAKERKAIAGIKRNMTKVLEQEAGTRKTLTLHEKIDERLAALVKLIQKDDGKKGAPVVELVALLKDTRARVNTLFRGKSAE